MFGGDETDNRPGFLTIQHMSMLGKATRKNHPEWFELSQVTRTK
jgi:hypothetical protein